MPMLRAVPGNDAASRLLARCIEVGHLRPGNFQDLLARDLADLVAVRLGAGGGDALRLF